VADERRDAKYGVFTIVALLLAVSIALPALAHFSPVGHAGNTGTYSSVKKNGGCEFRVLYRSHPVFHAYSYAQEIAGCQHIRPAVQYRDYGLWQYSNGSYSDKTKYCAASGSSSACEVSGWLGESNLTAKVEACATPSSPWYTCMSTGWYYP
jgi:hypothetical protein